MDTSKQCPLIEQPCIQDECAWFTRIQGVNPQTGHPVDSGACAMAWLPILMCQGNQMARQASAEVSAVRSELQTQNDSAKDALRELLHGRGRTPGLRAPVVTG
jgi:hypothetical protein